SVEAVPYIAGIGTGWGQVLDNLAARIGGTATTLLNALLNTASGASWVSIHHGGGVGMGRSIHAGQVCIADGTPLAAQKLERVLTNDPGMGVIRHVDAGYEHAADVARERGVRIPMRES
ncbi:hypothetical protein ACWDPG_34855, partial [Nocardia sp. NPDC003648]